MPLHIGIVGCSAEGAALCYRTLCSEGAGFLGPHAHPEVSMHTPSMARYLEPLERGDMPAVAELMLASARKLAAAGADFLICPDNTIHQAFDHVEARSPLPWLHIAEVVAREASARGCRRVGLTGTRWLVDSDVYPGKLAAHGIECLRPPRDDRDETSRIILEELVRGIARPESVRRLQAVLQGFRDRDCDAVVLGCTELPLVLDDANSPLPVLDSTRLLARAALRWAVSARPAFQGETARGDLAMTRPPDDLAHVSATTLAHYSERAEDFREGTRDHDVRQNIDALLRHVRGSPPFRILDFGCGPGRDLAAFRALGHEPVGLEGSAAFAAMAREHGGCEVLEQDFLALDLPAARFDGVFANASLFHVPSRELPRVLRELHATLGPEGVLFASNPRGNNEEGWSGGRYGVYHDLAAWRAFVEGAGFTELEHYYRPPGLPRHQQPWLASVWRKVAR